MYLDEGKKQTGFVNKYLIGADPEFAFCQLNANGIAGEYYFAEPGFGMILGHCFGADMNGRLVEIRPQPSRSTLAVVASMLATLRFMAVTMPATTHYFWRAGAFIARRDGIGGHIHFARQSALRQNEIRALDSLTRGLFEIDFFSRAEQASRVELSGYGRYGDIRTQAYGYEYRTMPSQLESPWQAFCALTLAKLAVYDPNWVSERFDCNLTSREVEAVLSGLIVRYKSRDMDAALLAECLDMHAFPISRPRLDIKRTWGIPSKMALPLNHSGLADAKRMILPLFVPPTEQDIQDLTRLFSEDIPLDAKSHWLFAVRASPIPNGWTSMARYSFRRSRVPGIVELSWDKVILSSLPLDIASGDTIGANQVGVTKETVRWMGLERFRWFEQQLKEISPRYELRVFEMPTPTLMLRIGRNLLHVSIGRKLREIIFNLGLPFYNVQDVNQELPKKLLLKWQMVSKCQKSKLILERTL